MYSYLHKCACVYVCILSSHAHVCLYYALLFVNVQFTHDRPVATMVLNSPLMKRTVMAHWKEVLRPNRMAQIILPVRPMRRIGLRPTWSDNALHAQIGRKTKGEGNQKRYCESRKTRMPGGRGLIGTRTSTHFTHPQALDDKRLPQNALLARYPA